MSIALHTGCRLTVVDRFSPAEFEALRPLAFVDDYLPYLRGVPAEVHTALVLRAPNGSPNTGVEMQLAKSTHQDLAEFTDHWLATQSLR